MSRSRVIYHANHERTAHIDWLPSALSDLAAELRRYAAEYEYVVFEAHLTRSLTSLTHTPIMNDWSYTAKDVLWMAEQVDQRAIERVATKLLS